MINADVAWVILALINGSGGHPTTTDAASESAASLVFHYERAGDDPNQCAWAVRAGGGAHRRFASHEALDYYDRALGAAERMRAAAPREFVRAAFAGKGHILRTTGDPAGALANFQAMQAFGEQAGDNGMAIEALNHINTIRIITPDASAGGILGELDEEVTRARKLALNHGDPAIPGRSDYIHHLADLLELRRGADIRVLEVGTGASVIYPLIGACEYGWSFVGSHIDAGSLRWAQKNVQGIDKIELRLQKHPEHCFHGVIRPGEHLAATMCNPPFHASAADAAAGTRRKQQNLGLKSQALNFGGTASELWCEGGELGFIRRMIAESREFAAQVRWFTTFVSKSEHLPRLEKALRRAQAAEVRPPSKPYAAGGRSNSAPSSASSGRVSPT